MNCFGYGLTELFLTCVHVPAGSPYYDNVRPLSYPDSDAVLICFDISRPETLDSVLKKVSDGERWEPFTSRKLHHSCSPSPSGGGAGSMFTQSPDPR